MRTTPHPGALCNRCGEQLVVTYDALSRPRPRCPTCDGVAPPPKLRVDEVRRSQAVDPTPLPVRRRPLPRVTSLLEALVPKYRCQECGAAVEKPKNGRARKFCDRCATPAYLRELEAKRRDNERSRAERSSPPGIRPLENE